MHANSGFTWQYSRGSDVGVCYGEKAGYSTQLIGVYRGFAPCFQPDPQQMLRHRMIGNYQPQDKKFKVGAQTLSTHGKSTMWLAQDDKALSEMMTLAEPLNFAGAK